MDKFLIRKGPFYCTKCFTWQREELAPRDGTALKGIDICKKCQQKKHKRKKGIC